MQNLSLLDIFRGFQDITGYFYFPIFLMAFGPAQSAALVRSRDDMRELPDYNFVLGAWCMMIGWVDWCCEG